MNGKICFFNKHDSKNNTFNIHKHSCYEIVYFLSGKGTAIIGGKQYSFFSHSFCVIPPQTEHTECIDGMGEIIFLGFDYSDNLFKIKQGMYFQNAIAVNSIIKEIMLECLEKNSGYEQLVNAKLNELIIKLSRIQAAEAYSCRNLVYIADYIKQHYSEKIDFGLLAKMSGYSYDYFRHSFKEKYLLSPQKYLIETRVDKSKEFLLKTELSCTEIGYACGFSNTAQFVKIFKEHVGITPKQFKKTEKCN